MVTPWSPVACPRTIVDASCSNIILHNHVVFVGFDSFALAISMRVWYFRVIRKNLFHCDHFSLYCPQYRSKCCYFWCITFLNVVNKNFSDVSAFGWLWPIPTCINTFPKMRTNGSIWCWTSSDHMKDFNCSEMAFLFVTRRIQHLWAHP